jgi:hypothetical protein
MDSGAAKLVAMDFPPEEKLPESLFGSMEPLGIGQITVIRPQASAGGRFFCFSESVAIV